ncbi:MAG: biopolymer transporter ExbD [Sulfuricurvum sp.]|jgi:biopolymer transport protein ExbD|nr:biopolymer transporter ExbD [Sulfuricurvum sp.]MDP3119971.1 biopolymer transporter ExbD [Sulfuricurvum sp.]
MKIKKIESINVIPFIDIMLVLLAIVLTTATFIAKGSINVELPRASASPQALADPIEITLDRKGDVYLMHKKVSNETLLSELQSIPIDSTIVINGDKGMEYQFFVSTIDTLTAGGYTHLSIASMKDE